MMRIQLATLMFVVSSLAMPGTGLAQSADNAAADAPEVGREAAGEAKTLFELLDLVKNGLRIERAENVRREQAFVAVKTDQERLLAEALATIEQREALSRKLELTYNANELGIGEKEALLAEQLGQLGELFGVVRQVATDASGQMWDSITSAQLGQRKELLDKLGRSKELPSTADLERLWYELQREMTEQGQVVKFKTEVLTLEGQIEEREVTRAGPFSAVSRGGYLLWEPEEGKLRELTRQPPTRYLQTVSSFEGATSGVATLAVDPSRGSLLNALTDTPSNYERIAQGGEVGAVIIVLGLIALAIGLTRYANVSMISRRVSAQLKQDEISPGNPLGRVLAVYAQNEDADVETLELRLDEAVLRESSKIKRMMWIVKTVSVVSPLLGLLGTVTGMIQTFQAITLFGAGDPKMMAGGISQALVTTMLGLIAAIPLVLLYDLLSNSSRYVVGVLQEQSAGLIAGRAERENAGI